MGSEKSWKGTEDAKPSTPVPVEGPTATTIRVATGVWKAAATAVSVSKMDATRKRTATTAAAQAKKKKKQQQQDQQPLQQQQEK